MTDARTLLVSSPRFRQVPAWRLPAHGLLLHTASLWGPLRASTRFRDTHQYWMKEVAGRFWNEYGLNLSLILVGLLNVAVFATTLTWQVAGVLLVLAGVPALTCIQMLVDRLRGDFVFNDTQQASAGLTVRVETINGTPVVRFFNHYGLPIGKGHGVAVRDWLMQVAAEGNGALVCRAQSQLVADHYLNTHPGGKQLTHGKSPLLIWNHSETQFTGEDFGEKRGGTVKTLIGWHSNRNSGQGF